MQLEQDNLSRQQDIAKFTVELSASDCGYGYPSEQQLKDDDKLVTFYTGLSNLTILMAVLEFLTKDASIFDQ